MKKILITGANSYIGTSFESYLQQWKDEYKIDTIDMIGDSWKSVSFSNYDVIFHVAGIAHVKESKKNAFLYYKINEELAIETALKAKNEKVKQFIVLSSMSVYGIEEGIVDEFTIPNPKTNYGLSKLKADKKIVQLNDDSFKVVILRPPMVYGKNCKGNYQKLRKFALNFPFFPLIENQRSMIFIDNLSMFVKKVIDGNMHGIFFPQDAEYICTSNLVKLIAYNNNKKIILTKIFNPLIRLCLKIKIPLIKKIFGNLVYKKNDSVVIDCLNFDKIIENIENGRQ